MLLDKSEAEIIRGFLAGEDWAARRIESFIRAALSRWKSRLGLDADDVLSDAQLEVLEELRRDRLENPAKLRAFVHQIVNHTALDYIRFRQRVRPVDPEVEVLVAKGDDPEEALDRAREIELGMRVVRLISEECRQIWRLRLVEGRSCREIGKILGISEGNVRQRIFACRESARGIRDEITKRTKRIQS